MLRYLMIVLSVLAWPAAACAQQLSSLDRDIQKEMAKHNVPGMAIAIVQPDGTIVERGYGVRSVETREAARAGDLFRTGSVNKMWTAAALLKAMEQKGHRIDQPIGQFLNGLPPALARLTVAQILSHQAGLEDSNAKEGDFDESAISRSVAGPDNYGFFAEPGQILSYSNPGFQLAGFIIERLTGKTYADAIDDLIVKPLGARHIIHRPLLAMTYPLAVGHSVSGDGTLHVVRPMPFSAQAMPSGYPFATAGDLALFARMMASGGVSHSGTQVLSPAIIAAMTTARAPLPESFGTLSYGYGVWISEREGQRVWDHGGTIDGYNATLRLLPDKKVAVAVMINAGVPGFVETIADRVLRHYGAFAPLAKKTVAAKSTSPSKPTSPQPVQAALAAELMGRWGQGSWVFTVRQLGQSLTLSEGTTVLGTLHHGGSDRVALMSAGGQPAGQIAIVRDSSGKVQYLAWGARAVSRLP